MLNNVVCSDNISVCVNCGAACTALGEMCGGECCDDLQCLARTSYLGSDVCLGALHTL